LKHGSDHKTNPSSFDFHLIIELYNGRPCLLCMTMKSQTLHFLHLFFLSLIFGMGYIHFRFTRIVTRSKLKRGLISGFVLSSVLAVFVSFALKLSGRTGLASDLTAWYAYLGLGYLSFLLFLVVTRDIILVTETISKRLFTRGMKSSCEKNPAAVNLPEKPEKMDRRLFLKQSVTHSLAGASFVFSGIGIHQAHKTPAVKDVIVHIKNLPESLSGFSIVQITDIHLEPTLKKPFLEKVVNRVNSLSPHVIALTGDLVDGFVKELEGDIQPLKHLTSQYGNFFVTGNHEYYFNGLAWIDAVNRLGFKTLVNDHSIVKHGDGRVLIAGVPDLKAERFVSSHRPDPVASLKNAPPAHVKILLAHQPNSVIQAAEAGFDIQISGHTHGGQIFPWNHLVALNQPFLAGLYTHGCVRLYVSRGTGYWGPPMRFCAPSEITRIILAPA